MILNESVRTIANYYGITKGLHLIIMNYYESAGIIATLYDLLRMIANYLGITQ